MIEVEQLTKHYGPVRAVVGVSFTAQRGEILGMLGANGAGKTTTLRMLTGFLPATSGRAQVAGFDVWSQSLEARRRVGYLPEVLAMYPEMRVEEYLRYRARLKGVARPRLRARLAAVRDQCAIGEVWRRRIGQLSKGYRQRLGLAEALVHDPEVVILDEPTVGLDPNQVRQVRALIKALGRERTVLLSTHILPEVEMVCDRVVILHQGRLVAMDTPDRLRSRLEGGAGLRVEIRAPAADVGPVLRTLPGVQAVNLEPDGDWVRGSVIASPGSDPREAVFRAVVDRRWGLRELALSRPSLEDVFVQITTREGGSEPS